ncbi:DUF4113 domain-containing protein [Stenotrophomonas sp. NPDC077461]|uniref:DUF4113 domain-containing protein n=1 Tax=Stenotrophomonas sp. NPDC077461 TaxID=3414698 RepID=UPI003C2C01F2
MQPRSKALMEVMERAYAKFGRGSMAFASSAELVRSGAQRRQVWAMNQAALSPAYTTRWDQLLKSR